VLLTLDGIEGDAHAGRTQKTGAREPAFRCGTLVANTRQLSLVSVEELNDIASRLGIAYIDPAWVAANIAIEGAGPITQLPPGTLLRAASGASIYVAELNSPCRVVARLIAQHVAYAGDASAFVRHAKGRRGVVGFVYAPGTLQIGDELEVLQAKPQPPKG
jgi:MOSC domain-containing protein YiiM